MQSSVGISFASVALFLFLLVTQILAVSLLPRTAAFTNLYWTVACLSVYAVSLWSLAYMLHAGMPLSLLIPILSALVPLAAIAVGLIFYKEAASVLRIVLLCMACGIIGLASSLK
jgi:quaternary ammonium compound-resistance protein SugE